LSLEASQRAETAARRTAKAASIAASTAKRESTAADAALVQSQAAEDDAKASFLDAQGHGFPKPGEGS
jgi:hypothetical protein